MCVCVCVFWGVRFRLGCAAVAGEFVVFCCVDNMVTLFGEAKTVNPSDLSAQGGARVCSSLRPLARDEQLPPAGGSVPLL